MTLEEKLLPVIAGLILHVEAEIKEGKEISQDSKNMLDEAHHLVAERAAASADKEELLKYIAHVHLSISREEVPMTYLLFMNWMKKHSNK